MDLYGLFKDAPGPRGQVKDFVVNHVAGAIKQWQGKNHHGVLRQHLIVMHLRLSRKNVY